MHNDVNKRVQELGISSKVKILGFRNDIDSIMSCSDILLMPSLFEGLPLTAIEAGMQWAKLFLGRYNYRRNKAN